MLCNDSIIKKIWWQKKEILYKDREKIIINASYFDAYKIGKDVYKRQDLTKNVTEIFGKAGYLRTVYTYTPYGEATAEGDVTQPCLLYTSRCV